MNRLALRRLRCLQQIMRSSLEIVRRSLGGRRHKSPFAPAMQALQNVRALHYHESDLIALGAVIRALHTRTAAVSGSPGLGNWSAPSGKVALARLKCGQTEESWRIEWLAAVTALRSVGYVLRNVDAKDSSKLKAAIADSWKDWNSEDQRKHAIFRQFIDDERHSVLKEYKFGAERREGVFMLEDGSGKLLTEDGRSFLMEEKFFQMTDGPYIRRDGRDVIAEAIEWWERELDRIEEKSGRIRAAPR